MPEPDAIDSSPLEPGAGAAAATINALPAGFTCPKCDYDLGGAIVKVCSECGRPIVPWDTVVFKRRISATQSLRAEAGRLWRRALVVLLIMGGGAMMLALDVGAAIVAVVLCGIAMLGSTAAGWFAASLAPDGDRAAIRLAWLNGVPWLNGPWLALPVFAVGGVVMVFAAASLPRSLHPNELIVAMVGVLAGGVWLMVSLGSVVMGVRNFGAGLREHGVKRRAWWPGIVVAFLIVIGGAMLLGVAGMLFAADAAYALVTKWSRGI